MFVTGPPGEADGRLKVIDFGTASKFNNLIMFQEMYGTATFMAPEVINKYYREKCDVWSLGIITYLLLSLRLPFIDKNDVDILAQVKSDPVMFASAKKSRSILSVDLIKKMLIKDQNARISAVSMINHPWLSKYAHDEFLKKQVHATL